MTVHLTMSRGPITVRSIIETYIKSDLPKWIVLARQQWGLDETSLPSLDPSGVFRYERDGIDHFPQHVVSVLRSNIGGRIDIDDLGAEDFRTTYAVRLYSYIRTASSEAEALRMRDDYATVLRWCLVSGRTMNSPSFEWMVETLTEEFSTGIKVGGDRWVGAVTHSFNVQMDEHNVQAPLGSADEISTVAGILV